MKNINYIKPIIVTTIFLLIIVYFYILKKNNLLFSVNNTSQFKTILDKKQSLWFEILELCVMLIVIYFLYKQKQYLLFFIFILQFLEHINQIIFCYRQNLDSLHVITIIIDAIFILYAYYVKCYWVIPLFIIGILIHVTCIYSSKSFTENVCIKL
jgi:hypothetical protein